MSPVPVSPAAPHAPLACRIVVMARWPAPGRCKRRLARSCGSPERAAAIQARLTSHTLWVAARAADAGHARLDVAVDGLGPGALRRWQRAIQRQAGWPAACRVQLRRQGGGNLGCRMQRQLRQGFASGAERVVLIGTDLPGLECRDLTTALARLEADPLVLGPAVDGGYWLIGMTRAGFQRTGARLMSGIPWGGAEVLAHTLALATRLDLAAVLLRQQRDLDERSDLAAWTRPLHGPADPGMGAPWR